MLFDIIIVKNNNMNKTLLLLLMIACVSCASTKTAPAEKSISVVDNTNVGDYAFGELIIVVSGSNYMQTVNELSKTVGVSFAKLLMASEDNIILMNVPQGEEKSYIPIFESHPKVKHAELNGMMNVQ